MYGRQRGAARMGRGGRRVYNAWFYTLQSAVWNITVTVIFVCHLRCVMFYTYKSLLQKPVIKVSSCITDYNTEIGVYLWLFYQGEKEE